LLGDGGLTKQRSITWTEPDKEVVNDGLNIVSKYFSDIKPKVKWYRGAYKITLSQEKIGCGYNPMINWLKKLDIWGQYSHERKIPIKLFNHSLASTRQLLKGLFTSDGTVKKNAKGILEIVFVSNSKVLCEQVRLLLLRDGILSTISLNQRNNNSNNKVNCNHDIYAVYVSRSSIGDFINKVGFIGKKQDKLNKYESCNSLSRGLNNRFPIEFTDYIYDKKTEVNKSWSELGCYVWRKRCISRDRLGKFAEAFNDDYLRKWVNSDIWWDEVKEISYIGEEMTYDLEVPEYHNFIANNLICHNSGNLEEDADNVLFLYRDSYYEEKPENKTTEVILAKQRQGDSGNRRKIELFFDEKVKMYREVYRGE
jgi:replicative DNA helicase